MEMNKTSTKSINKITFYNILSSVLLQGLAFFTTPIFSRLLGRSNYGIFGVYSTWVAIFSIVLPLQAHSAFPIAKAVFPKERQEEYQSSAVSLALASYVCIAAPIFVIALLFGTDIFLLVPMLVQGLGVCLVTALQNKFVFEYEAKKNFILSLSVGLSNVLLSLIFVLNMDGGHNYYGRIAGITLSYVISGAFSYIYILRRGKCFYSKEFWSFTLPITIPTIFHLLANILLSQSDRLMIDKMMDKGSTGVYSLTVNFTVVITALYTALNNAWVPFYYDYTKKNDRESIMSHSRNYLELFTVIICGFMMLSREVFTMFGGAEFESGRDYIPLLAVGHFFVFLYSFPVNYEFYNKKTKIIAAVTVSAAVCNIILNYFMINYYGIMGAVISTVISYMLQFIFHYISSRKLGGNDFPYRIVTFLPWILVTAAGCAVAYLLEEQWYIRWAIGFMLGVYFIYRIIKRRAIF